MPEPTTREQYFTTTDRILKIHWAQYRDPNNRRARFGGHINGWGVERLDGDVYRIPKSVPLERIAHALEQVLRPSDTALLVYPFGKTRTGSSAMRVRTWGVAP